MYSLLIEVDAPALFLGTRFLLPSLLQCSVSLLGRDRVGSCMIIFLPAHHASSSLMHICACLLSSVIIVDSFLMVELELEQQWCRLSLAMYGRSILLQELTLSVIAQAPVCRPHHSAERRTGCSRVATMYSGLCVSLARSAIFTRVPIARRMSSQAPYIHILTSRPEPSVSLITLNRPKALNALSTPLMIEVNKALDEAENDAGISAIVLTGSERAFAGTPALAQ